MAFVTKSVVPSPNHAASLWQKVLPCGSRFAYPAVWTQWVGTSSRVPTKSTACSVCHSYHWPSQTWGNWGCNISRVQLIYTWNEEKKQYLLQVLDSSWTTETNFITKDVISNIINAKLKSYNIMLQIEILGHHLNWTIDNELSLKT